MACALAHVIIFLYLCTRFEKAKIKPNSVRLSGLNSKSVHIILFVLLLGSAPSVATASDSNKAAAFFYRIGEWMDNFQLRGLDTNYIALPEHSWRVALTTGGTGLLANYTTWADPATPVGLRSQTTPSLELGFNVGYRGYGGGYSWDVLNAYTTNWNISLGSKFMGIELLRNVSTNLNGQFVVDGTVDPSMPALNKGEFRISNTWLTAWYALNAAHYSHKAAFKQSYLQKRTAGSLLLSLSYLSSEMNILDSAKYIQDEDMSVLFDGVTGMITRQVALGLGYGINYTPNHGKVLLHASANMQVICYSINHISYAPAANVSMHGEPQYVLRPASPVHVSGTMRAAVSWEINRWVHLSAWAQANNMSFASKSGDMTTLSLNNWHWQAHINVGVRFGAGKKRVREVLGEPEQAPAPATPAKKSKMPQWVTDYFFSPMHD